MHLEMELSLDASGRLEGTIGSGHGSSSPFSGTLELLKVLEDVVRADPGAGSRVDPQVEGEGR